MQGAWAVSFGMPSRPPDVWRADIEATRRRLPRGKLLSVSVVGTVQEGWSIEDLAGDYARCARWAIQSGADCVEANFSCPNVSTCDGQLYQDTAGARLVAQRLREAIGRVPLIIKIGHITRREAAEELLDAVGSHVDALAMVNTVATTVQRDGELLFDGQRRGIAGTAIRQASLEQVRLFAGLIRQRRGLAHFAESSEQNVPVPLSAAGVGGIATADDVKAHLAAGAQAVHLATAAMLDPAVGLAIRRGVSMNPCPIERLIRRR
jgi:dihydroorotate dehydrogenase